MISSPLQFLPIIVVLGIAPFALMMMTSYVRIVVVLSLVRNALGVQQVPPTMVINGLAIILSIFIMAPMAKNTLALFEQQTLPETVTITDIGTIATAISPPFHEFLKNNTNPQVSEAFLLTAKKMWPKEDGDLLTTDSFIILVPSFTITELTKAFQIGFLLFLPFVVIDLVVSNILLAMGMMMVSPMTISLPFKLLLFVVLDGWFKVSQGLMLGYS